MDLTFEHLFDYSGVMTAALDLAPDPGPLAAGVGEVNATLDRMFAGVGDDLAPSECAGLVSDLERIGRRFDALKLRLVARGETAAAARRDGFPDKAAWLARQTRQSGPAAARQARLADDLGTAPATGDAMAEGALSAEHASVITHALAQLPARVTAQQRARVEADLVAMAARFDPAQLRRAARRALASIEPDEKVVDAAENEQVTTEEDTAYATSTFTFHDNDDATVTGHFTVPALQFAFLRKILEAMTAPRRNNTPGARAGSDPATDRRTDWSTRRGQAFAALLERLPTDHLHAKTAATVVVHLDLDTLRGHLKTARLDTDDQVSAGQARRLACSAGILPAVLEWEVPPARTSAAPDGCTPTPNASPSRPDTRRVRPPTVDDRSPGARSTTESPGVTADPPTWPTRYRSAPSTTARSTRHDRGFRDRTPSFLNHRGPSLVEGARRRRLDTSAADALPGRGPSLVEEARRRRLETSAADALPWPEVSGQDFVVARPTGTGPTPGSGTSVAAWVQGWRPGSSVMGTGARRPGSRRPATP